MVIGFDASRAFGEERTGTENYSYQLLKALSKVDRRNIYRIYTRPGVLASQGVALKGWPENFQFKSINWPRLWTQGGLALECLLNPPDVLFIPAHTLPVIRRPNLKTVVTIHDLGVEYLPQYHQFPQKYYLNWSTAYAVKNATGIIAVSESTKQDLIIKLHCDIEVIRVIYEGVQPLKFETRISTLPTGREESETEKILKKHNIAKPYILSVGTIQPRKNLVRLIEAFSRLVKQLNSESANKTSQLINQLTNQLQLILVGKPGWLYEKIYAAPKKFGVENRVKFLNFVSDEDLSILYKEASVFCLPSLYEGFGLPVLEAMSYGIPVVISNTSSLPEVVGDAGILVDPHNVAEIAGGLQKIITDEVLRNDLIKKGKERVKLFTWEKTAKKTLTGLTEAYRK